jgi:hypothetical protein
MKYYFCVFLLLSTSCISSGNGGENDFDEISRASAAACAAPFLPKNSVKFVDFRVDEFDPRHAMSLSRARNGKWIVHILELADESSRISSSKAGIESDAQIQLIRVTREDGKQIFWVLESDEVGGNLVGLDAKGEVKKEFRIATDHFDFRGSFHGNDALFSMLIEAYSEDKSEVSVLEVARSAAQKSMLKPTSIAIKPSAISVQANEADAAYFFENGELQKWRLMEVGVNGATRRFENSEWELASKPTYAALNEKHDLVALVGGDPALGAATLRVLNTENGSASVEMDLGLAQVFFVRFIKHLGNEVVAVSKALNGQSIIEFYDIESLKAGTTQVIASSVLDQLNRILIWEEPSSNSGRMAAWVTSGTEDQGVKICKM